MTSKKDDAQPKPNKLFIPMVIVVTSGALVICILLTLIAWRVVELTVFDPPANEELPLYQPSDSNVVEQAHLIYDDSLCRQRVMILPHVCSGGS